MGVISKGGIRGEKKGPVVLASTVILFCANTFSTLGKVTLIFKGYVFSS